MQDAEHLTSNTVSVCQHWRGESVTVVSCLALSVTFSPYGQVYYCAGVTAWRPFSIASPPSFLSATSWVSSSLPAYFSVLWASYGLHVLAGLPCTYRYLDDDYSDGIVQKRMVSRYLTQSSKYISDKQVVFRYLEIRTLRR